jgi:Dyp-type peroxidase family
MFELKYYDAIKKAQEETRTAPDDAVAPFHFKDLGSDSLGRRLWLWAWGHFLPPALFLLRRFWPILKLGRLVVVTRDDDVRKVLAHPELFEVPYGPEMTELAGGESFVLGLEGVDHAWQRRMISQVLLRQDAKDIGDLSCRFANALIRNSGGRIDVMKDFITRVATETCIRYFGLTVDCPDTFAEWAMSISALLFADPTANPTTRALALNGARRIRDVIDRSIGAQRSNRNTATVLGRLLGLQATEPQLTDEKIRAILVGLVTGFIPTNTLAAGKILEQLLKRRDTIDEAMEAARKARDAAATNPDDNPERRNLQRILFEAARLNPALAPGQWRYALKSTVLAEGTRRATRIPQDSVLMVSTMSALRDGHFDSSTEPQQPNTPWPDIELMFGNGSHDCLGRYAAMAQITEMFELLLSLPNLRNAKGTFGRRIRWVGAFPRRLDMEFDPVIAPATQSMIMICAPLAAGVDLQRLREQIEPLRNPANPQMRQMLDQTGIVHFASLSLIEAGNAADPAPHLLLELNVDGPQDAAIRTIAKAASNGPIETIFRHTPLGNTPLEKVLATHARDLRTRPWGVTGLNFNGTPEFPVADIELEKKLSEFANRAISYFLSFHLAFGNRAMAVLDFVRSIIVEPDRWAQLPAAQPSPGNPFPDLLQEARQFTDFLVVPSRRRLQISKWKPLTRREALSNFARTWEFWYFGLPITALAILLGLAIFLAIAPGDGFWGALPGRAILGLVGGPAAVAGLISILAFAFLLLLRYREAHDIPDDQNPKLETIRQVAQVENEPGFAQNHFMAVTPLKPGLFRRLTLAMALWGIRLTVTFLFRPGFVLNMGTIHYAKWFRAPGRDTLIFLANFDGSWESYLEDFIMRAHLGQTAAWSNGVGFPRTRFLMLDGAQDGDRFKRWVRRQQVLAQFWYTRFDDLTTDRIRNNALIRDGLARAFTDSAARNWLDCFGSIPRPDYAIETEEVQSLLFRGQRYLPYGICALLRLTGREHAGEWLSHLVYGGRSSLQALAQPASGHCEITFGDHPFTPNRALRNMAAFVAFSASGLAKLGLSTADKSDGLGTFPATFNMGMSNRGRSLGDRGASSSANWRWVDNDQIAGSDAANPPGVDAALLIFADSHKECDLILQNHLELLGGAGALVHKIPTAPAVNRLSYEGGSAELQAQAKGAVDHEHFGFRDGISQPVIRGTQRFLKGVHERDIVEPGEFILGYRNNQGYYPPAVIVRGSSDVSNRLPVVTTADPSSFPPNQFPSFEEENAAARDFGRNGSFLVLRQLAQNVEGFRNFVTDKARELNDQFGSGGPLNGLARIAGAPIDAKWLAAKMMGRWPDGTPLIQRPGADRDENPRRHRATSNDFAYGIDDPQGLHCPFGAHMRRANPRDSLNPGDADEQSITNRHRLLRRGRTYEYQPPNATEPEKGLMFAALCADLDRQFEFVQQTWIQSPTFHDLRNEPDPMVAWQDAEKPGIFTIPTPAGPVRLENMESFVKVCAGGYFFLPSRSAILYLAAINGGGSRLTPRHGQGRANDVSG